MNKETTKCRVAYLSNLAEPNDSHPIGHNQAMLSGPNLNRKIMTAILKLRFDKHILCTKSISMHNIERNRSEQVVVPMVLKCRKKIISK